MIYEQSALSVQRSHIKYTVAPKEAYRLKNSILNFGLVMCEDLKKYFRKNPKTFDRRIKRP